MIKTALYTSIMAAALLANSYGADEPAMSSLPELMTSAKDNYWNTGTATSVPAGTPDITIDPDSTFQVWQGFGGTFNEMGWDALNVVASERERAMKLLFDKDEGANLAYGRIPLGASDYSMSWYSLAETPNDYEMNNFSIARDKEMLIPYIKAALAVKPDIHLWGSPWICPDWMKEGRNMKTDARTQEAYALYFARFVEEYAKEDLIIENVQPQNEPGYARVRWSHKLFIDFIGKFLGPKFEERNLEAEVWCGTMSHPDDGDIALECANDPDAMKYVKGFGLQWNLEVVVPPLSEKGFVWQTEHRCGNYSFGSPYWDSTRYDRGKPQNDHLYGEESWQLIRDWLVAGVHSYSAWNMILDTYGKSLDNWPQNALLVVDRDAKKLIVTPAYYVFRHFSQYIMPGATRIATSGSDDVFAFKNPDGSIITQIYNKNSTDADLTVQVGDVLYQYTVPGHGWATHSTSIITGTAPNTSHRIIDRRPAFRATHTAEGYTITLPTESAGHIDLLTINGRLLKSISFPEQTSQLHISNLVSYNGLILMRLQTNGKTASTRCLMPR